jgi:hypothetical protein
MIFVYSTYNVSFRRILKGQDFAENNAKLCFKRLILQPRPSLSFHWDGTGNNNNNNNMEDESCPGSNRISSILQRWNLQIRNNYQLLKPYEELKTNEILQILLITRSVKSTSTIHNNNHTIAVTPPPPPSPPLAADHILHRLFANQVEIISALQTFVTSQTSVQTTLLVSDMMSLPFEEQITIMSQSSIVIGMHGAGIMNSIHMPIGTRYCCGILEIIPSSSSGGGVSSSSKGYRGLVNKLGMKYERLDITATTTTVLPTTTSTSSTTVGSIVPIPLLLEQLKKLIQQIVVDSKGSCIIDEVRNAPYL